MKFKKLGALEYYLVSLKIHKVDKKEFNDTYLLDESPLVYVNEFEFHPTRKWMFDHCIPKIKLAWEYEGLMSKKSRHTTATGYTGDCSKYNAAQKLGWIVLRYTTINASDSIRDLDEMLELYQ